MFYKKNLLKNEYLPLELPPCFNTDELAANSQYTTGWVNSLNIKTSIPHTFSGFKNENSRRKFAIPNPYHYIKAVDVIVKNSEEIFNTLDISKISLSKPLREKGEDYQTYKKITNSIRDTRNEIEKLYQNNQYQIKLDISSFFDSIYTHSIPWAMHTKKIAKVNKSKELAGNALDSCMQAMNHAQTNGILVGNAVSRIISEIILCTVDKKIQEKFKNISCKRFVDDYYIFVKDSYNIQSIISFVRNELGKYELLLNENKIQILESPFIYGKSWVEELKLYIHLDKVLFFNKVISLYLQYKDISILRYGITVISMHNFSQKEWINMESKIINIWVKLPSLSDLMIRLFIQNKKNLKKTNIKKAIHSILERNIPLNNHQEVIWAVWFAKVFNIAINRNYLVDIIDSENDIAIIILLDMIHSGICKQSKELSLAIEELKIKLENTEDIMMSSKWILAYEIDLNGWLNNNNFEFKKAREHDFFKKMIRKDIRFYKPNFEYEILENNKRNVGYITREEFYKHIERIDKLIKSTNRNDIKVKEVILKENKKIMDEISKISDTY